MPFLPTPLNQQRQSTEGICILYKLTKKTLTRIITFTNISSTVCDDKNFENIESMW